MNKPKKKILTIITVVKNDEENILKTIRSTLEQTFQNFEYIIIDGFSDDNTFKIIKSVKSKKIRCLRVKDKNMYDAINRGIKISSGKYIGLIHSGDLFFNKIQLKKIFKASKAKPDIISGNVFFYKYLNKKMNFNRIWCRPVKKFNLFSIFKIPHTSIFIKKEILEKINFYDTKYSISSDMDMLIKILKINRIKLIYLKDFVILMKMGGLSQNKKFLIKKIKQDLIILFKHYKYLFFLIYIYKILIKIPGFIFKKNKY